MIIARRDYNFSNLTLLFCRKMFIKMLISVDKNAVVGEVAFEYFNNLTVHDKPNKLFIIDVALRVFLVVKQLLNFFVTQLLAQRCKQVSQFSRRNKSTCILVKMTQTFNEIISSITRSLLRYCLKNFHNKPCKAYFI